MFDIDKLFFQQESIANRPRRGWISPTYWAEFPWRWSRWLTSYAAVEFFHAATIGLHVQFFDAITEITQFLVFNSFNIKKPGIWPIHFVSAFVAVIFSQLMASSSALWRLNKPPSSFVSGHESTMCSMVCCSPQTQSGDEARPHLCMLARHGPWPMQKWFNSVQEWRDRSKPGCWIVGSHTSLLPTKHFGRQELCLPR